MSAPTTGVSVLDLRGAETDAKALDEIEGAVVVLDEAESAAGHDLIYQQLLGSGYVSDVLCILVATGTGDEVEIDRPPSLEPADRAAVLWVGSEQGIVWGPGDRSVRRARRGEHSNLAELLSVLHHPDVLRAVVDAVNTLPFRAASPGMLLRGVHPHEDELRHVQSQAVDQFVDPTAGNRESWELPFAEFAEALHGAVAVDRAEEVLDGTGKLHRLRAAAQSALETAETEVKRLDDGLLPLGADRAGPRVVGAVDRARASAREFHGNSQDQAKRVEDTLRNKPINSNVVALGVAPALEARPNQVRDQARGVVGDWLLRYRSIGRFWPELDGRRKSLEPEGRDIGMRGFDPLAPPYGGAPDFRLWPTEALRFGLVAASGVLAALGLLPVVAVPVLALVWFGVGLLLEARTPTDGGERGWWPGLGAAARSWLLPMVAGVLLTPVLVVYPLPVGVRIPATVLAAAVAGGTLALSWRRSPGRWRAAVDLPTLREQVERTDQLLSRMLREEWRPSANRALLADGLRQVALGLETIGAVLRRREEDMLTGRRDEVAAGAVRSGDAPQRAQTVDEHIREVIVGDLADLTLEALAPCWDAIESGRSDAPVADVEARTGELLDEYRAHVLRRGLLAPPRFARSDERRANLAAAMWQDDQVRAALVGTADEQMVQLCRADQLPALPRSLEQAVLVRFGPDAVRKVPGLPGLIVWTGESEVAGTLRLVPLRQGVFR